MTEIYVVSAFCKDGKGGNLAGVVVDTADLTREKKQEIAAKMGFSETVFVSEDSDADYRLEYFTPADEVPLCGHATIAAFSLMHQLGMLDRRNVWIATQSGKLRISVEADGLILMEQNAPEFYKILPESELSACMEENVMAVRDTLPIQMVSTGLKDILVPIDGAEELARLKIRLSKLEDLSRKRNAVGAHAFALCPEGEVTAICRNFAPLYGIDEESATGTSNCALACYLYHYGIRQERYVFEQGYSLGSPSRIVVHLKTDGETIREVFVGGYGRLIEKRYH